MQIGFWQGGETPFSEGSGLLAATQRFREPIYVLDTGSAYPAVAFGGQLTQTPGGSPVKAVLPALYPEWLGSRAFREVHGIRFPYVAGAMANGIATTDLVIAMAKAGMLGFFGAAGLALPVVEKALDVLEAQLGDRYAWGSNLIHSPNEPALEAGVVDLYLRRGVRRVSASAYMSLSKHVVRYAAKGLTRANDGTVQRQNYVFAKISRPEVAKHFMSPPPAALLKSLVQEGHITAAEAELAVLVPVAEDIIVESDSGGHTDNQALGSLFPNIANLRDEIVTKHTFPRPIRLGAAGGIGTPRAVASAFALGADFVLTGSVNQSAIESGLAEEGRKMLAIAQLSDVVMAAAADMFELGVKVQVLKRGTMFGNRANKLYEIYRSYPSLDAIPAAEKAKLEKSVLGAPLSQIWEETASFWRTRDAHEIAKAERDPKHKMALCFRWYLGQSSRWAIRGLNARRMDYQIWCGPAMGSFNAWVKGTFLEPPEARTAVQIARNLLEGAAMVTRAHQLRAFGVQIPDAAFHYTPRPLND